MTHNLRTIGAIPLSLPANGGRPPALLEVRGEVYLPIADFARLNEQRAAAGESTFANPRNSAAGSIRQLDPKLAAARPLSIWCYGIGASEGLDLQTHFESLEWLRSHGFRVNRDVELHEDFSSIVEACHAWEERREHLDFEIDGVVVKVNDFETQRELGVVGREPRWAIAFKFSPTTAVTKLEQIGVNVGRTGNLVPYAMLKPVEVGGVTVSRATLHNEEDLARKDIREGDEVVIMRAGDVIPQVVSPITQRRTGKEKPYVPPAKCPECGTPTVKPEGEVWTRCPNRKDCPGQIVQALKHFVSRGAMDIEGYGEKLVIRFYERGPRAGAAGPLRAHGRAARAARGVPAPIGREPGGLDRALQGAALPQGAVRARHPRHRRRQRPSAGRAFRVDGPAAGRLQGGARGGRGHGPDPRRRRARDLGGGPQPPADRGPARARG